MSEDEIIGTFEHWIEYEKANKDKINKADELIEIQQGLLDLYQQEKEAKESIYEDYQDLGKEFFKLNEKIKEIRDKAEVMDYYTLNDVIDDLTKLIGDGKDE